MDIDIHEEQKNESTTKFTAKDRICDSALKGKICDNSAQIKKAFSLIQLSLILLVISIVIAGIVSVSSNQTTNQKLKNSNDNIKTIYQALEKYLVNNKSLPCPASLKDIKSSATTYGQAVTTSNCVGSGIYQSNSNGNLVYGMVPVQTLGLKDEFGEDAYGNKIVYIVDSRLTTVSGFETNSGNSTIISINSGETINALFVVMSRGANAAGAFPANSATATSASSISGEQNNDLTNIVDASLPAASTADFGVTFTQSSNDSGFDDIVFYKTREQLLGDTNYWSIISCPSYISNESYGNFTWPKGYENQIVASTTSCPIGWQGSVTYPTKKCGSKGVWGYNVNDCTVSKNCSVSVTGSNTTSVSSSSGSISCDKSGYTGSVTYVCSPRTGVATITGSCTQLSKNCSVSVTGVSTASVTNDSGTLT
ncbi:MAG: hypothetical protein SFV53_00900, partial [Rickettsiales bacterium]|nr:hypothetical protein [Rickettsiales bacterium]